MGRRCIRRLLALLSERVEPAEGSYQELAGSEWPGTSKGPTREPESPSRRECHRRHHHSHPEGFEASSRRHGRRHTHRRHANRPDHGAAVVATGTPAESPVIGYPEIYKAKDEEPERSGCSVQRRHRHGHQGMHVHHHLHGEVPPPHLQERHRRNGCSRHSHRCRSREHVHFHYDRDNMRAAEGVPSLVAVGQPAALPAKSSNTITRRSSI